ncbi:MAG: DUF1501 domain-containing protein [Bacteroidota bacterium]
MASTTLFSSLINLRASSAAAMSDSDIMAADDYKAMVCILFEGGNDAFNMLMPYTQSEYTQYQRTRGANRSAGGVALERNTLRVINPTNTGSRTFGLHPSMPNVQRLFGEGKAAFVANVGTLIEPITKAEFWDPNRSKKVPLGLLSHSDQAQQWMTALPHERAGIGWGGRIADMVNDMNCNPELSMGISMAGTNIFQTGVNTVEYALNPAPLDQNALTEVRGYGGDWALPNLKKEAIDKLLDRTYADIYENTYMNTVRNSIDGWKSYREALNNSQLNTVFQSADYGGLAHALGWVAKMIGARQELGYRRQTFFVRFGGFDHHDEVINAQSDLLAEFDYAINQFNAAMEELGTQDAVCTFSISDFARTLGSNGNGTDHAWGGNAMIFGGPNLVNGGQIFGAYPETLWPRDNPVDLGGGILVPTTSADLYFAEISKWFGVSDSNLQLIFPNLTNFYDYQNSSHQMLGFLNKDLTGYSHPTCP